MRYTSYNDDIKRAMKTFFASLSEHDRRGYAAIEACKLGHGGIGYIADLLGCSERTVRRGLVALHDPPPRLPLGRSRKKGEAANAASAASQAWRTTLRSCSAITRQAIPCARKCSGPISP